MENKTTRKPLVGLATALFLVVSLSSAPSVPSVPVPQPNLPSPDEVRDLEHLASWLAGSPEGGLQAMSAHDLRAAIREQPGTFDIFRRYNGEEASHRYLLGVPFGEEIYAAARHNRVDSLLVAAMVKVESGFTPNVVSPQGAVGLMQVLPSTAGLYGAADLGDPRVNLDIGSRYLSSLLNQYAGDLEKALAAYNAGPGNVDRFGGVPPFAETRAYVGRVLAAYVENHRQVWEASGTQDLLALR